MELQRANRAFIELNLYKDDTNQHSFDSVTKNGNLPKQQDISGQSRKSLATRLSKYNSRKSESYVPSINELDTSCSVTTIASRIARNIKT